ncbi:hypothetical protein QJS04_geneDACA003923 [Acorus gramineus]|uniref:Uncharacterized protein n=1 Tax=Acorus gramineus TaxID=55184 RepID=A0AAV9BHA6_ACOGR|nr:hypothetical protein QJS04_geneDACA003923 [Acorus gramineus]
MEMEGDTGDFRYVEKYTRGSIPTWGGESGEIPIAFSTIDSHLEGHSVCHHGLHGCNPLDSGKWKKCVLLA